VANRRGSDERTVRRALAGAVLAALALLPACGGDLADTLLGRQPAPATDDTLLPPSEEGDVVILQGRDLTQDTVPGADASGGAPGAATTPGDADAPGRAATGAGDGTATGTATGEDGRSGEPAWPLAAVGAAALVALALTAIAAGDARRLLHAWRSGEPTPGFAPVDRSPTTSFSLVVPTRPGAPHLADTLDDLARTDHPTVEVLAVVGHDDEASRRVADAAAARHPDRVRVVVDRSVRTALPGALDAGLAAARHDVVGVVGQGDALHPQLLRHVDATLAATRAGALQAPVETVAATRWYQAALALDRWFWFRSRLPGHARQRFTPLATTNAFVRTDTLRAAGGWGDAGVAPGTDLGVRLSVDAVPVAVAWDPTVGARTLAPTGLRAVARAEADALDGALQALRRRAWARLPGRRQRLLARYTLAQPVLAALAGPAIPLALVAAVATGTPLGVVLLAAVPLVPATTAVVAHLVGAGEMARSAGTPLGARRRLALALGLLPHRLLLAVAALRALGRQARPAAFAAARHGRRDDAATTGPAVRDAAVRDVAVVDLSARRPASTPAAAGASPVTDTGARARPEVGAGVGAGGVDRHAAHDRRPRAGAVHR
jgi:hypothetical protein